MTVQYHPDILNETLAPGIADFTEAEIPDLRGDFPEAGYWISNHFLNTIFEPKYKMPTRHFAINMMSRAQAHFSFYHQARQATHDYLAKSGIHSPAIGLYYNAVFLWEICLLNYQIFVDLYCKLVGKKAFGQNDGSVEQRAYDIVNDFKHWAGKIKTWGQSECPVIPLWLTNSGVSTHRLSLAYTELASITAEIAKTANDLQNPGSLIRLQNGESLQT